MSGGTLGTCQTITVDLELFKAMVQLVLIFVSETWVVNPGMDRVLWGVQNQMARQLMGRLPRQQADGKWEYTLAAMERAGANFEAMEEYIRQRQNIGLANHCYANASGPM